MIGDYKINNRTSLRAERGNLLQFEFEATMLEIATSLHSSQWQSNT